MSYQLANLAVRFNVGGRGLHQFIRLPKTSLALKLASLFKKEGLIQYFYVSSKFIEIKLKYFHKKPLLKSLEIVSKPGRRIYWSREQLSRIYSGRA
jgi:small subunit ribosomal protein S8